MITLLIDTHSDNAQFALFEDDKLLRKVVTPEEKDHSSSCVPTLVQLLERESMKISDISDIVIVNGPGSFTGVRIGVTIAKTIAWSLKIPIRTISSLELYRNYNTKNNFIGMKEKNGYYVACIQNDIIEEYQYINKIDFENFQNKHDVILSTNIDYKNLIKFAHKKDPIDVHLVNPFYVKKIEVEK